MNPKKIIIKTNPWAMHDIIYILNNQKFDSVLKNSKLIFDVFDTEIAILDGEDELSIEFFENGKCAIYSTNLNNKNFQYIISKIK